MRLKSYYTDSPGIISIASSVINESSPFPIKSSLISHWESKSNLGNSWELATSINSVSSSNLGTLGDWLVIKYSFRWTMSSSFPISINLCRWSKATLVSPEKKFGRRLQLRYLSQLMVLKTIATYHLWLYNRFKEFFSVIRTEKMSVKDVTYLFIPRYIGLYYLRYDRSITNFLRSVKNGYLQCYIKIAMVR